MYHRSLIRLVNDLVPIDIKVSAIPLFLQIFNESGLQRQLDTMNSTAIGLLKIMASRYV